jgi:hypothetical protein
LPAASAVTTTSNGTSSQPNNIQQPTPYQQPQKEKQTSELAELLASKQSSHQLQLFSYVAEGLKHQTRRSM